jgi:autotransporter family porin
MVAILVAAALIVFGTTQFASASKDGGARTAAKDALVELSPSSGASGATIEVTGTGFASNRRAVVTVDEAELGVTKTDRVGSMEKTVTLPSTTSDSLVVRVAVDAIVRSATYRVSGGKLVSVAPTRSSTTTAPASTAAMSSTTAPTTTTRPVTTSTAAPTTSSPPATTAPTTTTSPVASKARLLPAGSSGLSDADAADRVRRSPWEPRPANTTANHRVPSSSELATFRAAAVGFNWGACEPYKARITGNFTGTTDEIIQWAAWKWGLDEDLLRAQTVRESNWKQDMLGDYAGGKPLSYGLLQLKSTSLPGSYPLSQQSTAFNADHSAALLRHYFDGCATWLADFNASYAPGDIIGSLGAYYSGRWYNSDANWYIGEVKRELAARAWEQPGF